ncbi:MAG: cytochrome c3 family protein, partial [Chloroflexi bacterium]|nr:cytochrome c3 family protein [Chloroflexota bacterium]
MIRTFPWRIAGVAFGVVTALFALSLVIGSRAEATPDYASKTNQPCGTCHVNPAGGGELTATGAAFKAGGYVWPVTTSPSTKDTGGGQPQTQVTPGPGSNAGEPFQDPGGSCAQCHQTLGGKHETTVKEWNDSAHKAQKVGCADCHGGDRMASDAAAAMSPKAGFIGKPAKADIPKLCGYCHSDINRMRQYGVATDQLQQYQESQHGKLLAKGDTNVATCYDCHGGHNIKKKSDPTATVYPPNVPTTCAKCHANETLMKPYGIPTDQYSKYQQGIHGQTLLEKQDQRAPSCANCHGSHGATPPGVKEVANVCAQCHSATYDLFANGGHELGALGGEPKCISCHGQHDIKVPDETAIYTGTGDRTCSQCHAQGTPQKATADKIYEALASAGRNYAEAEDALSNAEANRMVVVAEKAKLDEANTNLIEARAAQHTVNLATITAKTKVVVDDADAVKKSADAAISESNFRRQ